MFLGSVGECTSRIVSEQPGWPLGMTSAGVCRLVCVLLAVSMCIIGCKLRRKAMSGNDGDDQDLRMGSSSWLLMCDEVVVECFKINGHACHHRDGIDFICGGVDGLGVNC